MQWYEKLADWIARRGGKRELYRCGADGKPSLYMERFKDYVDTLNVVFSDGASKLSLSLSSMWVNDMKAGEYNTVHHPLN